MARQVQNRKTKTSKRSYVQDKQTIKCGSCGIHSSDCTIKWIGGIARWVCNLCASRIEMRSGR